MFPAIQITDADIRYAESILLPVGKFFDEERKNFIKNLSTIDLQAVPGSGKTTALLAKLIILETKLPFDNGAGVLILSHTNAAIDEIKEKIQHHCPQIFRYPNFIGTIQSFVNEFLAVPYYVSRMGKKPVRIDQDIYLDQMDFQLPFSAKKALINRLGNSYPKLLNELFINPNKELVHFYTEEKVQIPRLGEHTQTYKELSATKIKLLKDGILSFNDCYALAKRYLQKFPSIANLINKRFNFVFVDEMQDMDVHQYELIERIFIEADVTHSIIQRIGDKNQSIYNSVKSESIWTDRSTVLRLSNSQRLSQPIANIVKNFALYPEYSLDISGLHECQLKPHILLFSNVTIRNVVPFFVQLVKSYRESGELITDKMKSGQVKVISWNTDWKDDEESRINPNKVRLEDYCQIFKKNEQKPKEDYDCLRSYLHFYDKRASSLAPIRKNIINALLKILRIERIYADDNRPYTIHKVMDYLRQRSQRDYEILKLKIFQCSMSIVRNKTDHAFADLRNYIPIFISYFINTHTISASCYNFINIDKTGISNIQLNNSAEPQKEDLNIEITSVHAVKGQTHEATLYLESYFNQDGNGLNAKSYESQRLANQFLGQSIESTTTERNKQSTKMAYVGFSRATQLLCVAIHEDRFNQYLSSINKDHWEVKKVL